MKLINFHTIFFLFSFVGTVTAQTISGVSSKTVEAQMKFESYLAGQKGTSVGSSSLISVINDLPKTKKDIAAIRALLVEKTGNDEKITAISLLGSMYDRNDSHGENNNIRKDLKNYVNSPDKKIASAALFALARTGYDSEYVEIIRRAKERGIVSDSDYYGEHAHQFRFSPEPVQNIILGEIEKSRNSYGLEILASDLKNQEITVYSPDIRKKLLNTLKNNEPSFPKATGEYGGNINYYYGNWLYSFAKLSSADTGASLQKSIFSTLSVKGTDPRKILLF